MSTEHLRPTGEKKHQEPWHISETRQPDQTLGSNFRMFQVADKTLIRSSVCLKHRWRELTDAAATKNSWYGLKMAGRDDSTGSRMLEFQTITSQNKTCGGRWCFHIPGIPSAELGDYVPFPACVCV